MDILQTEYEFTLPKGYIDKASGNVYKTGAMRLACAADEILPMKDPRVQHNPSYLNIIIMSRVVIKLGDLLEVNTKIIENLFSSDFNYLQKLYNTINQSNEESRKVICPKCEHPFTLEVTQLGEA